MAGAPNRETPVPELMSMHPKSEASCLGHLSVAYRIESPQPWLTACHRGFGENEN